MARPPTYFLAVNMSASQVRKRLKGYGFGVRDVQATDRKQAVILHTATGEHLHELEALFADVIDSNAGDDASTPHDDSADE